MASDVLIRAPVEGENRWGKMWKNYAVATHLINIGPTRLIRAPVEGPVRWAKMWKNYAVATHLINIGPYQSD